MIINTENCTNVASAIFVRKLNVKTIKHERPYQLQWFNECGEIRDIKQVFFFFFGKYKDEVLCKMVPLHATHLLLGNPW